MKKKLFKANTYNHGIYKLPHEFPNDKGIEIIGN